MEKEQYLVWSNEHRAWWRSDRCGYSKLVKAAGRYSREEALEICANARDGWGAGEIPSEIPVRALDVADCMILDRRVSA